jgi:hypothetical protein
MNSELKKKIINHKTYTKELKNSYNTKHNEVIKLSDIISKTKKKLNIALNLNKTNKDRLKKN